MNKKGMTLVEVIVAIVIVAVLALSVTALINPLFKSYNKVEASSDAQMIGESLMKDIRAKTNYAKVLTCGTDVIQYQGPKDSGEEMREIKVNSKGYLQIDDAQDFDDKYYMDMKVGLACEKVKAENLIKVKLSMLDEDGAEVFVIDATLRPLKVQTTQATNIE